MLTINDAAWSWRVTRNARVPAPGGACVYVLAGCGGVVEAEGDGDGDDGGRGLEDELAQGGYAGGAHGQAVVAELDEHGPVAGGLAGELPPGSRRHRL